MTDTQDKPNPPDSAHRLDDLVTTIRTALDQDAGADARTAGAIACRAILGALDPTSRATSPPATTFPATTSPMATSPIVGALGTIGQIPREQVLQFLVGGLRSLLSQRGPIYLTRPAHAVERAAESEQRGPSTRATSRPNGKRSETR